MDFDGGRTTFSLNGEWEVEEGPMAETPPASFGHRIPVPSLIHAAQPPFEEAGVESTRREAFWFRRRFTPPVAAPTALLRLHKAKYGAAVWLNGEKLGSSDRVYSMSEFDAARALRPGEQNTLVVRVGADRSRIPPDRPAGFDFEKHRWLPGLWDDVALVLTGDVYAVRVKIEPDLDASLARVFATVRNDSPEAASVEIEHSVREWQTGNPASAGEVAAISLAPFEERTVLQEVPIDPLRPWSPKDPHLYVMTTIVRSDTSSVLDDLETRFGMRTTRWRGGADPGFFLNGRRLPLRGSNITLHRFFEDPEAGMLPWDEAWLRTLLVAHPKSLDWNVFRMTIGRAPNRWYDILDEAGILVADEFAFWGVDLGDEIPTAAWSAEALEDEFVAWVQESWNHPSIAWWDAANENVVESVGQVVARVRSLDRTRAWEGGGWRTPLLLDDPIEHHPYLFARPVFDPSDLDAEDGLPPLFDGVRPGHPWVANEYGFLWIGPDGLPTPASERVYERLLGPGPYDPREVREAHGYLVGGMTEFLRARRGYTGVQHFVYLTHASPEGFLTADEFVDHRELVFESRWLEYARNAFSEVGVYLDSWRTSYPSGEIEVPIVVVNDTASDRLVTIRAFAVSPDGTVLAEGSPVEQSLGPVAATEIVVPLVLPAADRFVLYAEIELENGDRVWSRRKVGYPHPGSLIPDPPFE